MPGTHRLTPGSPVCLAEVTTKAKSFHQDKQAARKEFRKLRKELIGLQARLYAENRRKLLILFQAMDAGGKDSTIRRLLQGVNPQGVHVTSFKVPTHQELAHDFLWRVHNAVPGTGTIGVFNRSHYEDVIVVRVHDLVPESVWRPRFEHINEFEQLLAESGTTILKFYLHISKDEQKKRFEERLATPEKNWKFSVEDVEKRRFWDDYMLAFEEALNLCTTAQAPWYVIPADKEWYRDLAVMRVVVHTLREMNPQFPPCKDNLEGVHIE